MSGVRVFEPTASGQTHEIDTEDIVEGGVTRKRQVIKTARSLTERMFARAPQDGYSLWLDTADLTHIYIAEAPTTALGDALSFQGIRVTKDATGNPLGKVEIAVDFAWVTRTTATWT